MQSAYMVLAQPGAAGVEHFRAFYDAVDCSVRPEDCIIEGNNFYFDESETVCGPYPKNLHLGGAPVAMTLRMVGKLIPENDPAWHVAKISPNSMEYEIAGFLLVISSLDARLKIELYKAGWFNVQLSGWIPIFKPILDVIRRCGMFGSLKDDCVYGLRKILNVTYRRDHQADWVKEKYNRCCKSYGKVLLSGGSYIKKFYNVAKQFEKVVTQRLSARSDMGSSRHWFARRHHHIPSGSTSVGSWIRKLMQQDPRMGDNDRPSKKSVFEALDYSSFELSLSTPPIMISRASTKHEPGDKRRALYATNEVPYLISAFASVHAEKEMRHLGSVARQGIEDWKDWLLDCQKSGYWLSADLADYNSEHESTELAIMNIARAQCWLECGSKYGEEKASAHAWLAHSMFNSWIQFPDEHRRVFSGLFSGSRDTMRDNTAKHTIDIQIQLEDCRGIGYPVSMHTNYQAGDDEDSRFATPLDAAVYINVMAACGHNLNPRKQLAGRVHHEFLQVMMDSNDRVQRPLSALVATLASGNWYVPTATWFGAVLSGVADNWWEAVVRGLDLHAARHMAAAYLDTMMRVRSEDAWVELDWWPYRSCGRYHPLWETETPAAPVLKEKPESAHTWPSLATDDWLEEHKGILQHADKKKVRLYREELLQDSHGKAFLEWRQQTLRHKVLAIWPVRIPREYTNGIGYHIKGFSGKEMASIMQQIPAGDAPRDEGELCSRLGIDPQILGILGSWSNVAQHLDGPHWAKYAPILPSRQLTLQAHASSWAFRSWASRCSSHDGRLHSLGTRVVVQNMLYIHANNGAGKSYLIERNNDWMELDSLAAKYAGIRPKWISASANRTAKLFFLSKIVSEIRATGCKVFLGQWGTPEVIEVCDMLGINVTVCHFEPGEDLRVSRLLERGFSEEKIERRRQRWEYSPQALCSAADVTRYVSQYIVSH